MTNPEERDDTQSTESTTVPPRSFVSRVEEALESLSRAIATDSRDWAATPGDAWIWGIVHGWGIDPDDPDSADVLPEIASRHGWSAAAVEQLRQHHAAYAQVFARLRSAASWPGGGLTWAEAVADNQARPELGALRDAAARRYREQP